MRNVKTGSKIPSINYADQPYVVVTPDGNWVCVLTTGSEHEGSEGQHVVSATSADQGKTWSALAEIEPPTGPEASWVCPLVTKFGRVYAFYTYNGDKVHLGRDDTHGWYAYRYSDDAGRTWSEKRYRLPMRATACDKLYKDGELVQMFWGICKPIVVDETVYFSFTKLGVYFQGNGEGWLFRSDNILTETDPEKIHWEMLPQGEHGIRHPDFGSVQEEHNLAVLSNGDLVCVYRTTQGWPAISYSHNNGKTWSLPEIMRYTPDGRAIRTPRACPKIWRCNNRKFLFWFHNNGGKDFNNRNPVWLSGGVEKEGVIHWSQPEILLYHDNPDKRMSYPDLIEQGGRYWVTETEKEEARIHEIDPTLLEGLWGQFSDKGKMSEDGLALSLDGKQIADAQQASGVKMPKLPDLSRGGGFTIEMWIELADLEPNQVIIDSREGDSGIAIMTTEDSTLGISLQDGKQTAQWDIDRGVLKPGTLHHVVFIVDGGPKIISCVVDGQLCDGSTHIRQFGWSRFNQNITDVSGEILKLMPRTTARIKVLRIYSRYLRISEAIGNWQAEN